MKREVDLSLISSFFIPRTTLVGMHAAQAIPDRLEQLGGQKPLIVTDQGIADLRHKDPVERAHAIIDNCAHPMYRELLRDYLNLGVQGQTPHHLKAAFAFHNAFNDTGDMRNADYGKYI